MRFYQSHKEVRASEVVGCRPPVDEVNPEEGALDLADGHTVRLSKQWFQRHNPHRGGYLVIYQDGYASFSPKEAFEEGYTRLEKPHYYIPQGVVVGTEKLETLGIE